MRSSLDKDKTNKSRVANRRFLEHWQKISFFLMVYDAIVINFSYFFALWLRFDFVFSKIEPQYLEAWLKFTPFYTVFALAVFWFMKMYNSIWRFASSDELAKTMAANIVTTLIHIVLITVFIKRMPISYYIVGAVCQFVLTLGIRFSYRFVRLEKNVYTRMKLQKAEERAMIIGAGSAGQLIIRDLLHAENAGVAPCCVIDDNPNKWERTIEGIPIVGGREDILSNVEKYKITQILFAIPSISMEERRDILNICKETSCELKILPGVYQIATGEVSISKMKPVAVEDLLGRDTVKVDMHEIEHFIEGKVILVTGGGGSIGSELCRQIVRHNPKKLIIFEIYENNAYDIQQELKRSVPDVEVETLIGSVRDTGRINWIFEEYKPQVVYHAAAHKHVPLMEDSPCEAIKNNVMGTYKTAYAALTHGCERFVLISTDKAVNPTNVMGASKRLCEMVIQSMNVVSHTKDVSKLPFLSMHQDDRNSSDMGDPVGKKPLKDSDFTIPYQTEFVAVRFGNVLGSNGSVIPLFKKQIMEGGPVTVTHPDIIRYFMTIPEAVNLVLQAGCYAKGGEIFVLDMGAPVKIDTLARNLIKLSGFKPDVDIKIEYTGLRPGEKLYEEKLMAEEGMKTTPNKLIHIGKPIDFDTEQFFKDLEMLAEHCYMNSDDIKTVVKSIVPTYQSPEDNIINSRELFEQMSQEVAATEVE